MQNKEFTSEGGHKIVIKPFITLAENRTINDTLIGGMETGPDGKANPISFNNARNKTQDKTFEIVVVSVDGKTDNIVQEILSLPKLDAQEVIKMVDEVTSDKKKE